MHNDTTLSATDDPIELLLVEDNPGDVRLVREALKKIDHEINLDVVTDGDTAVAELVQQNRDAPSPDLVLLDLNLPGRDGCAVLNAVRADTDVHTLPVLMLSSSSTEEDVARCYDAKANAYLTKPCTLHELCELMEAVNEFWFAKAHLPSVSA